jgi:hypothetical protein
MSFHPTQACTTPKWLKGSVDSPLVTSTLHRRLCICHADNAPLDKLWQDLCVKEMLQMAVMYIVW